MNDLPIWPPLVALALGLAGYALTLRESREFDRKHGLARSGKKQGDTS